MAKRKIANTQLLNQTLRALMQQHTLEDILDRLSDLAYQQGHHDAPPSDTELHAIQHHWVEMAEILDDACTAAEGLPKAGDK